MSDIEMIKRGFADDHRGSVEFYNDLDFVLVERNSCLVIRIRLVSFFL